MCAIKIDMAILDSFTTKSGLYWKGLLLAGLSFAIFFGTIWYSVVPTSSYNNDIWENLSESTPMIVGSLIFLTIGAYMTLEGRKSKR